MKLCKLITLSLLIMAGCNSQTGTTTTTTVDTGGDTLGSTTVCDFLSTAENDAATATAMASNENGASQQSYIDAAYIDNICVVGGSSDDTVTAADCVACAESIAVSVWQDCGDAVCGDGENCGNCAADCGECCGNDICDTYEGLDEVTNCPQDCNFGFCSSEISNLACVDTCGCRRVIQASQGPCLIMADNLEGGQCSVGGSGTCCVCEDSPDTCE